MPTASHFLNGASVEKRLKSDQCSASIAVAGTHRVAIGVLRHFGEWSFKWSLGQFQPKGEKQVLHRTECGFNEAQLAALLRHSLGDMDIGNNTRAADALHSALMLDVRMSGRGEEGLQQLLKLSTDEISDLALDLAFAIETDGAELTLPLGTLLKNNQMADFTIGGEHWILDAGRPGLHAMEAMRRDAHGPNLELLNHHIERMTRRLVCRRLGLPSPHLIMDTDDRHLLQFAPCVDAGDVVLQRYANGTNAPRFAAALPAQIRDFAASIVADMRFLWKRRKEIGTRALEVRRLAESVATETKTKVNKVMVDLHSSHADTKFSMYIEYEGIDEAMRVGPVLDFVAYNESGDHWHRAPWGVTTRYEEREKLQAAGADGMIDDIAAAIVAAAPAGSAALLAQLAEHHEAQVVFATGEAPMFATLYWRDGVIRAEVSASRTLDLCENKMELLSLTAPETIINAMPGRSLSQIAELPFQCECRVLRAESLYPTGVRLEIEIGKRLINLSSGRIWNDKAFSE